MHASRQKGMSVKRGAKRLLRSLMSIPGAPSFARGLARRNLLPPRIWSRLPVDATFEIVLPGGGVVKYHARPGDGIGRSLYYRGLDEWVEAATSAVFLRELVRGARTFVDVGANTGIYSLLAAAADPRVRVVAFEPVASTCAQLTRLVALNGWTDRIRVCNAAVSDHTGRTLFHVPDVEFPLMGSLNPEGKRGLAGRVQEVSVVDLDSALEARPVDLVKIDVEGFEDRVLEGMRGILERDRPRLIVECAPDGPVDRVEAILTSLGYVAYHLGPSGPVPARSLRSTTSATHYNFLFLPGERAER